MFNALLQQYDAVYHTALHRCVCSTLQRSRREALGSLDAQKRTLPCFTFFSFALLTLTFINQSWAGKAFIIPSLIMQFNLAHTSLEQTA
eukprot:6328-Heterococcus_DN1.PRE.1